MPRPRWLDRLLGTTEQLGLWTLPVFVAVGLTGAVLAGTLAVVWYGQQVDALEEQTRAGREELEQTVEEVRTAGQEALDQIGEQVESVRESLTRALPFDDATARGVVVVRAVIGGAPPPGPSPPESPAPAAQPSPQPVAAGQALVRPAAQQESPQPDDTTEPSPSPSPSPRPPPASPAPPPREDRVGTGFAVADDAGTVFYATTFGLLADPDAPGGISDDVEIVTRDGAVSADVHSWDEDRDLALLQANVGGSETLQWRPQDAPITAGARVVTVGVTPDLDTVQVPGTVGHASVTALVTDLPRIGYLRGAPVVDSQGLVVAVLTAGYEPFGPEAGRRQAIAPVHLLCERMLRNCETLEGEVSGGSGD